jgi:hypothetical protein
VLHCQRQKDSQPCRRRATTDDFQDFNTHMSTQDQDPSSAPREEDARAPGINPLDTAPLALKVSVGFLALLAVSMITKSANIVARSDPQWLEKHGFSIAIGVSYLGFCAATWKCKRWGVIGLTGLALLNVAFAATDRDRIGVVVFRAITLAPAFYFWNRMNWR